MSTPAAGLTETVLYDALVNYLVQGGCADITKEAMIRAADAGLELIMTVHDELVVVTPIENAARAVRELREAMEGVAENLSLPFYTDAKWSTHSFGSLKPWTDSDPGTGYAQHV